MWKEAGCRLAGAGCGGCLCWLLCQTSWSEDGAGLSTGTAAYLCLFFSISAPVLLEPRAS